MIETVGSRASQRYGSPKNTSVRGREADEMLPGGERHGRMHEHVCVRVVCVKGYSQPWFGGAHPAVSLDPQVLHVRVKSGDAALACQFPKDVSEVVGFSTAICEALPYAIMHSTHWRCCARERVPSEHLNGKPCAHVLQVSSGDVVV